MEMKANELRIGNLFREKYTGEIISVLKLEPKIIVFDFETEEKWQAEPIPLTEEWLLKLGFIWAEGLRMFVIETSKVTCEPDDYEDAGYSNVYFWWNTEVFGFEVSNEDGEVGNCIMGKLKYVHQLQNLYFALTGEELTIKL